MYEIEKNSAEGAQTDGCKFRQARSRVLKILTSPLNSPNGGLLAPNFGFILKDKFQTKRKYFDSLQFRPVAPVTTPLRPCYKRNVNVCWWYIDLVAYLGESQPAVPPPPRRWNFAQFCFLKHLPGKSSSSLLLFTKNASIFNKKASASGGLPCRPPI